MNCGLNILVVHYTTEQLLFGWLVQLPVFMLIMGFFMFTAESTSRLVMTTFGYDDNTKLTLKSFLFCSTVIPAITLLMQTTILAIGAMTVMGMLDDKHETN